MIGQDVVKTPLGDVKAGTIVVATKGYYRHVGWPAKTLIPIHSMMVATEPLSPEQIAQIHFSKRYCFGNADRLVTYGHLTADNRIAFGCRGTYIFGSGIRTFHPGDRDFENVRETLLRFFPGLRGVRFTHAWGGCMGVTRALRPAIVFDRSSGRGWAGGYFGNGVGAGAPGRANPGRPGAGPGHRSREYALGQPARPSPAMGTGAAALAWNQNAGPIDAPGGPGGIPG